MTKEKLIKRKKKWEDRLRELHAWPLWKKAILFFRYTDLKHWCEAEIETCEEFLDRGDYAHVEFVEREKNHV